MASSWHQHKQCCEKALACFEFLLFLHKYQKCKQNSKQDNLNKHKILFLDDQFMYLFSNEKQAIRFRQAAHYTVLKKIEKKKKAMEIYQFRVTEPFVTNCNHLGTPLNHTESRYLQTVNIWNFSVKHRTSVDCRIKSG